MSLLESECVEHRQKGNKEGYGHTYRSIDGKLVQLRLHRAVFYDVYGYFPNVVRHSCDNPRCINPYHLLPGNHADNMRDKVERGRCSHKGGRPSGLDTALRESIIAAEGTIRDVAARFGVSHTTVSKLKRGLYDSKI